MTTLVDQGFSSISNFAVGVAVARAAGARGLGAFALAYAGWLVVAGLHRALVAEPMAIEGDARRPGRSDGIARGLAAEVVLGATGTVALGGIGLLCLLGRQEAVGSGFLALAPWLPFLVVQDYWRWVAFMRLQPHRALANDAVFNCVQAFAFAGVLLLGVRAVPALIAAWGLGGAAGAAYGLRQHRLRPRIGGGVSLLRQRWGLSKWLAGTSLIDWGGQQGYLFVVGALLGPVGLGGLKAAQMLVAGPSGVLIQAGGSLGLPEASKAFADKGWRGLGSVTRVVALAGLASLGCVAVVVLLAGRRLLEAIYGPSFGHLHLASQLIAIGYLFIAFNLGPVLVLKVTKHTHLAFQVQVVYLAASLISVTSLSALYGVNGAAGATIATYGVTMVWCRFLQWRVRRAVTTQKGQIQPAPALVA